MDSFNKDQHATGVEQLCHLTATSFTPEHLFNIDICRELALSATTANLSAKLLQQNTLQTPPKPNYKITGVTNLLFGNTSHRRSVLEKEEKPPIYIFFLLIFLSFSHFCD